MRINVEIIGWGYIPPPDRPTSKIFQDRKFTRRVPEGEDRRKDEAKEINVYNLHNFTG